MPKLAFDLRANHDTGVSRYGLSVLAAAAPLLAEAGWQVRVVARSAQTERAYAAVAGTGFTVEIADDETGFVRHAPRVRELLADADLYYTSHYTVDRRCPVPFVFTIHDLTRLRFPSLSYTDASFVERFGSAELGLVGDELRVLGEPGGPTDGGDTFNRYFRELNYDLARRAERVIVVSEATGHDVRTLLGVAPHRVASVPCGVDTETFHRRAPDEVADVRTRWGLTGEYLVFVGLTHPNKRFPWLVEALVRARALLPESARLVAVGGHAEQVPEVALLLAEHGAEDFVVYTGRVSDRELAALYTGAAALVTASVNEGNNLPPLEALACGCEVVATDIPPLRETLGEHATFYDPGSQAALTAQAASALRGSLRSGARRFRPPIWAVAGHRLVDVLTAATRGTDTETETHAQRAATRSF